MTGPQAGYVHRVGRGQQPGCVVDRVVEPRPRVTPAVGHARAILVVVDRIGPSVLSLTYLSSPVGRWTDREVADLLGRAREKNEQAGVTGMLLHLAHLAHLEGTFVQTLEGPADEVDALFTLIDSDHRHHGVHIVRRVEVETRAFTAWWMGFARVAGTDAERLARLVEHLTTGRFDGEELRHSAVRTFHRVFHEQAR